MSKTQEAAHTPGPWFTHRSGFSTVYIEARIGGGMLQEVAACGPTDAGSAQQEANARLIAAAPKMAEALKLVLAWYEAEDNHEGTTFYERMDMCRASEVAVREALAMAAGIPMSVEKSAVIPSLALTAFIQDVEAAEGDAPAQCRECAGTGRVAHGAKVDNSGRTDPIWISCNACEGTGMATGSEA